jgi:hypothetical protein
MGRVLPKVQYPPTWLDDHPIESVGLQSGFTHTGDEMICIDMNWAKENHDSCTAENIVIMWKSITADWLVFADKVLEDVQKSSTSNN